MSRAHALLARESDQLAARSFWTARHHCASPRATRGSPMKREARYLEPDEPATRLGADAARAIRSGGTLGKPLRHISMAVAFLFAVKAVPVFAQAAIDLEKLDGPTAIKMMEEGKLTSVKLTKAYIDRIEALNKRGPGLNAVTQLNPDALEGRRGRWTRSARRAHPRPGARPADPAEGPDRRRSACTRRPATTRCASPSRATDSGIVKKLARERRRDPRQARPVGVREQLRQPAVGLLQPHRPGDSRPRRRPEPERLVVWLRHGGRRRARRC